MTPQDFIAAYEKALASQRWEQVSPLVHEDTCVTFSEGTFKGKAAVQKAFESTFALIKEERYAISNLHWIRRSPEYAVCIYNFHWSGLIDGVPARGSGRGTSVLIKQGSTWQLLTEHLGPTASK